MVVTAAVCALVALGALVAAAVLRHERATADDPGDTTPPVTTTTGAGVDGCLVEPCLVLGRSTIGGTEVQLIVDAGNQSGRLQIGGAGASNVLEVTITKRGATLGPDSLQCVGGAQSACMVRGSTAEGMLGQLVVGRTGKWALQETPFVSDAGFVALQEVRLQQSGLEVLVAQHRCDPAAADCAGTPVYVQVFNVRGELLVCTRNYQRLESLPGWPAVDLSGTRFTPCE